MNIFVPIIVTLSVVAVLARICVLFSDKIKFFAKGYDYGFLHVEISTMWKLAKKCKIKPGDSLTRIARQCGCTVHELAKANGLSPMANLRLGQTLKVKDAPAD